MNIKRYQQGQVVISIMLIAVSALCFLKYFAWASLFSGVYGLPSEVRTAAFARRWSLAYLCGGMLAESALIANLVAYIKLDSTELSGPLKVLSRGIAAVAIASLGTIGVVFLFAWVGKVSLHGR
jgi:hypothetical protein